MLSARKICAPASIRNASYSKNPLKKTGSFEDLIYNDALARGQRPGQKRVASGWNVERKLGCPIRKVFISKKAWYGLTLVVELVY